MKARKLKAIVAGGAAIAWVWLTAARGGFWRSEPSLSPSQPRRRFRVTAVIPARNEAQHLQVCLESLLTQQIEGDLYVVLVDDNSTDGTGTIARALATADNRLQVIRGEPLPAGWSGKLWAVAQGLQQPEARSADFILLTDADILHDYGHLAMLLAHADTQQLDLLSEMVKLRTESFAERATLPAFVFFFGMLYPFAWVNNSSRATAAAAGGTMLVRRAALDRIDGVDRIRGELIDDVALARELKRGGRPVWLGHASAARSLRQYTALGEVWQMIARTAYVQLGHSPLLLAGTVAGMLLLYAAPVWYTVRGAGRSRWLGVFSWSLMAALFQPTLRRYRQPWWWGLALPGIAMFYLAATIGSAVRFYAGQGGAWKGRVYPQAPKPLGAG